MMMMQMLRIKATLLTMSLKTARLIAMRAATMKLMTMAVTMKMKMLTTDDDDDDHYIYTR